MNFTTLGFENDTVYVNSECDSLRALLFDYEREVQAMRHDSQKVVESTTSPRPHPPDRFSLKWFGSGFAAGVILLTIVVIILKFR